MTWRPFPFLLTLASVFAFVGCSVGPGNLMLGNPPPTPAPTPAPNSAIASIMPSNANAGGAAFTLTVTGEGFVAGSTVNWNGTSRATTETSDTELSASITAADITTAGAAQITVVTPAPGGGTSNPVGFVIKGTGIPTVPGYMYVADSIGVSLTAGNISVFSVDADTGALTPISGSPFEAGAQPTAMTIDPTSKFLYESSNLGVITPSNNISAFTISPTTGALTPVPGSPFMGGIYPLSVSVDSTGKFLYTADSGGDTNLNSISEFSIDATTGALTPISQAPCGSPTSPEGIANAVVTDPVAGFLFASDPSPFGSVCAFSINSLGALEAVTGSLFPLTANVMLDPRAVAVDPFGKFLYTANYQGGNVSAFGITPGSGVLTQVQGSPFSIGAGTGYGDPSFLTVDPLGRFLYVADFGGGISGFSISPSNGALSMLSGFPISAQVAGVTSLAVDPSGQFLYLTNSIGQPPNGSPATSISAYAINETTGVLTPLTGSPYPADGIPQSVTVTRKVP